VRRIRSENGAVIEKGAIGIGELKENIACDSPAIQRVAELAREYDVPMLLHFEEEPQTMVSAGSTGRWRNSRRSNSSDMLKLGGQMLIGITRQRPPLSHRPVSPED